MFRKKKREEAEDMEKKLREKARRIKEFLREAEEIQKILEEDDHKSGDSSWRTQ